MVGSTMWTTGGGLLLARSPSRRVSGATTSHMWPPSAPRKPATLRSGQGFLKQRWPSDRNSLEFLPGQLDVL